MVLVFRQGNKKYVVFWEASMHQNLEAEDLILKKFETM
jgi:hypothetical protein